MSDSAQRPRPLKTYSGAIKRSLSKDEDTTSAKRRKVEPDLPVARPKLCATLDSWVRRPKTPIVPSSSHASSDDALFSDQLSVPTPPSSPPLLPVSLSAKDVTTGPGNHRSNETEPDVLVEIDANNRSIARSGNLPTAVKVVNAPLIQMQIKLGKDLQKTCRDCGMTYVSSSKEDVALHASFHARHLQGVDLGKAFRKFAEDRSAKRDRDGSMVVIIDAQSKPFVRAKAREVLDVVQNELGAVDIADDDLWAMDADLEGGGQEKSVPRHRFFLYLVGGRCLGLCLATRIKQAYPVVLPDAGTPDATELVLEEPVNIRWELVEASVGISRVWTSKSHRKQGIASILLDRVCSSFDPSGPIDTSKVAFSQPTTSGAALAKRWFGADDGWLVYLD